MADDPSESIDTRLVRRLAGILRDTGLSEIEVERGDLKIRVVRQLAMVAAAAPVAAPAAASAVAAPAPAAGPAATTSTESLPAGEVIPSPMVGTAYLQAHPESPPFIEVGDTVHAGQTLLIVEAMKTMNPIAAPKAGTVRAILVGDGQPVEYGQPLVVVE